MPRSKLKQTSEETDVEAEAPSEVEVVEVEPEVEAEAAPEVEVESELEPEVEPKRRRFGWRRTKAVAAEPETAEADVAEPDESEESDEREVDESETEPEPVLVPHRTAPKGLKIAAAVAAGLVIAAAGYAGAMVQPYLSERADVQIKQEVAETAAAAITSLWTYTPQDIDQLADRTARYLGGDFAAQYKTFIDSIAEANKQAQVTNQTQVVGAAVESLTPTEATAIVYTNSVSTTPNSKGFQSMRYLSYRLTLENRDQTWLITKMNDITSLDLAPQI